MSLLLSSSCPAKMASSYISVAEAKKEDHYLSTLDKSRGMNLTKAGTWTWHFNYYTMSCRKVYGLLLICGKPRQICMRLRAAHWGPLLSLWVDEGAKSWVQPCLVRGCIDWLSLFAHAKESPDYCQKIFANWVKYKTFSRHCDANTRRDNSTPLA